VFSFFLSSVIVLYLFFPLFGKFWEGTSKILIENCSDSFDALNSILYFLSSVFSYSSLIGNILSLIGDSCCLLLHKMFDDNFFESSSNMIIIQNLSYSCFKTHFFV